RALITSGVPYQSLLRSCATLRLNPATTVITPLSLHDALPISRRLRRRPLNRRSRHLGWRSATTRFRSTRRSSSSTRRRPSWRSRSEEHTSELQSRENLVCRLLLEKKKIGRAHV